MEIDVDVDRRVGRSQVSRVEGDLEEGGVSHRDLVGSHSDRVGWVEVLIRVLGDLARNKDISCQPVSRGGVFAGVTKHDRDLD